MILVSTIQNILATLPGTLADKLKINGYDAQQLANRAMVEKVSPEIITFSIEISEDNHYGVVYRHHHPDIIRLNYFKLLEVFREYTGDTGSLRREYFFNGNAARDEVIG